MINLGDLYLGIDGGGTSTKCLLASESGQVLARGVSGPSNYLAVGRNAAAQAIRDAIEEALGRINGSLSDIKVAALGMAGGDRPKDQVVITEICREMGLKGDLFLDHDAMAALLAGTDGGPGVVLIAGTGSIGFGLSEDGTRCRVDGWGYVIGDQGSGYDIGRQALIACMRHYDGRGECTLLYSRILEHTGVQGAFELVGEVYGGKLSRARIAGLAPVVFRCASEGDHAAAEIVTRAGQELGLTAGTVVKGLGMAEKPVQVVCAGGVFQGGELILRPLRQTLGRIAPLAVLALLSVEPVVGALYMAFRGKGRLDGLCVARIKASYESMRRGEE